MKKTLLALSLSLLSMSAFAAQNNDTPALLSALADDGVQTIAMSDNDMADTKGGAFTEYYYAWKNYGSQRDYRYYMYNGESNYSSGKNGWHGYAFLTTIKGINSPMSSYTKKEENAYHVVSIVGSTMYYDVKSVFSNWNRPSGRFYW